jgi:hypothetical protein
VNESTTIYDTILSLISAVTPTIRSFSNTRKGVFTGFSASTQSNYNKGTKGKPKMATFTPTKSFFRDTDKPKAKAPQREGEVEHIIYSDEEIQEFCLGLDERELETAAILIEYQMVTDGQPKTSRRGGSIWREARAKVISGLIQFGGNLSEVRGEMEGGGMEIPKTNTDGVVL